MGLNSSQIAEAHFKMEKHLPRNYASQMLIDLAMYDLRAKELGVPLYELLGGKMRNASKINRHIGIMSTEEAKEKVAKYRDTGFTSVKMKVGVNVQEDVERVRAVRQVLGKNSQIRVDGNGGYTYPNAVRFVRGVYDCNIEMYEQLINESDFDGNVALRREMGIPTCMDEGIHSVKDAVRYAACQGTDMFTIKLVKTGGLWNALAIAKVAQAAGIICVVASTYDTQINAAACLHLAVSLPNSTIGNDLTCYATQAAQANTCHCLQGNMLYVGDEPGIGVCSLCELDLSQN
jgi:L-alanine-DL-glutamate epimerase-like enolase superfamily enzyme